MHFIVNSIVCIDIVYQSTRDEVGEQRSFHLKLKFHYSTKYTGKYRIISYYIFRFLPGTHKEYLFFIFTDPFTLSVCFVGIIGPCDWRSFGHHEFGGWRKTHTTLCTLPYICFFPSIFNTYVSLVFLNHRVVPKFV